jgi:Cys-tRNA(Pro)/Cys-tRNA(Cys) deacylase
MLPQKDLLPLTGYLRGGCSPIGMKKAFPTFLQDDAELLERISVSAGVRGCQVILAVDALMGCTNAKFADLCRK